jgi:hypothetical protein
MEVAATPLKLIVLVPWLAPKLLPLMVTEAPNPPALGLIEEIMGMVPGVKVSSSNVAVAKLEILPYVTAKPT